MDESPLGDASVPSSEVQSARSCRSMVVRAARGDRETGTQRTLSLCQVAARTLSEDLGTRGRGAADHVSGTHPAWIRLCRCLGAHLAAGRVLRPEGPRTPTLGCRHRIPRRTSTEERTRQAQKWGMHMVSVRSAGLAGRLSQNQDHSGRMSTFLSGFPGLPRVRRDRSSILLGQMLSKARRPIALPSHACILG